MRVFHGTGHYAMAGILTNGFRLRSRSYTPCHKASFCTTLEFWVGELFAVRKTAADDVVKGVVTGIVLEFELTGTKGVDFDYARDPRTLQNEHEVVVYTSHHLHLVAVWHYSNNRWQRLAHKEGLK